MGYAPHHRHYVAELSPQGEAAKRLSFLPKKNEVY